MILRPILLDAGHGGFINGKYDTERIYPGGKQYHEDINDYIYEGLVNRTIRDLTAHYLRNKFKVQNEIIYVSNGSVDVSLAYRIKFINKNPQGLLVSIHCNAGRGTGYEVFTSPGHTGSDEVANVFEREFEGANLESRWRGKKESNFAVLRKTKCIAILTENLFMDSIEDRRKLQNEIYLKKIALWHATSINSCVAEGI